MFFLILMTVCKWSDNCSILCGFDIIMVCFIVEVTFMNSIDLTLARMAARRHINIEFQVHFIVQC